ncbi:glycosyltransferase family 4 protein, partial [Streptomyces sp. A7024]
MKIAFLLYNAYGIGGTIRSTFNLAGALSKRHDVTIVSVHKTAKRPALPLAKKVKVVDLVDLRKSQPSYEGGHPLAAEQRTIMPSDGPAHGAGGQGGLLSEIRIEQYLRGTDADVVVATRPFLVACLAEFGDGRYLRIGQEHLTHSMHREPVRSEQNAAIAGLDAWITVSEGDAEAYRKALGPTDTHIQCIPNGSPAPAVEPAAGDAKVVVAAGRLIRVKRYERLIEAFGKVAAQRPDWTLRIYGRGGKRDALRQRIDELGLHNNVFLMGPHSPIETEWAKGAIAAVSSDGESFGMTIVEAMHCGVPVISTDCDYGPGEIITDGQDGVLVPMGKGVVDAYADALLKLIDDEDRRHEMGRNAREKARRYLPERIAERYEDLFALLRPVPPADEPALAATPPAPTAIP